MYFEIFSAGCKTQVSYQGVETPSRGWSYQPENAEECDVILQPSDFDSEVFDFVLKQEHRQVRQH